jgi:hypothetical protein
MSRSTDAGGDDRDAIEPSPVLGRLSGLECWHIGFSYGQEMYVSLGGRRRYVSGPLAGTDYGEWELYTRASPWVLYDAAGGIRSSHNDAEAAASRAAVIVGAHVKAAALQDPGLGIAVEFDTGHVLSVPCPGECSSETFADDDDSEVSCWELLMPEDRCLEIWCGKRWRIVPYERT